MRAQFFPYMLALFLWPASAFAGQHVIGSVKNGATGASVAGANVKLEGDALSIATSTDGDGQFRFSRIPPGEYKLTVSAQGFYPLALKFALAPRAIQALELELEPTAELAERMEVRTKPLLLDESQGASIALVKADIAERLPMARRTNIPDLVAALVPSAVSGHDNLVHLRGNELSLNVSINGVSFLDNPHQLFAPGLNPDVIRSFTVITGGFPAEYGNRFGGILDVVTRSGFDEGRHGAVTLGASTKLRHAAAVEYGGHAEKLGYFFHASAFQSARFLNPPEPEAFHDFGKGSRMFAQLDYRARNKDAFRLVLMGGGSNFQIPNTAQEEERGRDFSQHNREATAILTWDRAISADSLLVTSLYGRSVSSRLLPTGDPISIQASGLRNDLTFGLRSDYTRFVGSKHAIKAGLEATLLRLREDFAFDPRRNEFELAAFSFRGRRTGGQFSLYLQDRLAASRNLTMNLGLRYDQYSLVTSEAQLSPRINLAYHIPGSRTIIHLAYNRFFAPPPIENLLLSAHLGFDGRPPLPSESNHYEAGVSQDLGGRLLVRLTAFRRDDRNSFEMTELANVRHFLPTAFDRGRAYGAELSLELVEISRLGLSGYFSYAAQRAFQIGPIRGGFAGEEAQPGELIPAAFDQIHTAAAGLLWRERRSGLWANITFEYGSGTPAELHHEHEEDSRAGSQLFRPAHEGHETIRVRLPQHLIVSLHLGMDLFEKGSRRIRLQLNLENITDRVYGIAKESRFTPIQFSPPRYISGSMSVRF